MVLWSHSRVPGRAQCAVGDQETGFRRQHSTLPSSQHTDDAVDSGNGPRAPDTRTAPSVADRDPAPEGGDPEESGTWLDRNRDDLITYGAALLISLGIRT